jgi:ATP-binding cassette subfamily B protein
MMLAWPLIALGWAVTLVQRGEASMARINALFREHPAITSPANPAVLPPRRGARSIAMEGVWFRYPSAHDRGWVLQDVSFRVEPGQSLAIVGATGSGKSTVAELLARSYDPDKGRVLLDGLDIRTISLEELRQNLGVVPQEPSSSAPRCGKTSSSAPRTTAAWSGWPSVPAGQALPTSRTAMIPCSVSAASIFRRQKQRAAIARALAQDPPVFILDDA